MRAVLIGGPSHLTEMAVPVAQPTIQVAVMRQPPSTWSMHDAGVGHQVEYKTARYERAFRMRLADVTVYEYAGEH